MRAPIVLPPGAGRAYAMGERSGAFLAEITPIPEGVRHLMGVPSSGSVARRYYSSHRLDGYLRRSHTRAAIAITRAAIASAWSETKSTPRAYTSPPAHIFGRLKHSKMLPSPMPSATTISQPSAPNLPLIWFISVQGGSTQRCSHRVSVAACCALALGTTS